MPVMKLRVSRGITVPVEAKNPAAPPKLVKGLQRLAPHRNPTKSIITDSAGHTLAHADELHPDTLEKP